MAKRRKVARKAAAAAPREAGMTMAFMKKELMLVALFIIAFGFLWLASELGMIMVDKVAAPFLLIVLGFIVAVTSFRAK